MRPLGARAHCPSRTTSRSREPPLAALFGGERYATARGLYEG